LGGDSPQPLACFGEVGLTGELRSVGHPERRLEECRKFGLRTVVAPEGSGSSALAVASLRAALRVALPPERSARAA
jgi:DNA repair protein RadA/Sms